MTIQEQIHANWTCGHNRVKQSTMYLFKPQSQEQHSPFFSKGSVMRDREASFEERFSEHLSKGKKPSRKYLAQKIFMFPPKAMVYYEMLPHVVCGQLPEALS